MKLTIHLHLAPTLKMPGAIRVLSPNAFTAWVGTILPFISFLCLSVQKQSLSFRFSCCDCISIIPSVCATYCSFLVLQYSHLTYHISFYNNKICGRCNDINLLKPTRYVMYQQVKYSRVLLSAHTVFISEQKVTFALYSIN